MEFIIEATLNLQSDLCDNLGEELLMELLRGDETLMLLSKDSDEEIGKVDIMNVTPKTCCGRDVLKLMASVKNTREHVLLEKTNDRLIAANGELQRKNMALTEENEDLRDAVNALRDSVKASNIVAEIMDKKLAAKQIQYYNLRKLLGESVGGIREHVILEEAYDALVAKNKRLKIQRKCASKKVYELISTVEVLERANKNVLLDRERNIHLQERFNELEKKHEKAENIIENYRKVMEETDTAINRLKATVAIRGCVFNTGGRINV